MTICGYDVFADPLPWFMSAITLWVPVLLISIILALQVIPFK